MHQALRVHMVNLLAFGDYLNNGKSTYYNVHGSIIHYAEDYSVICTLKVNS